MIFKKYNVRLFLLCVVVPKTCVGIGFWKKVDKSLETALKLDTGFDYPSYDELCDLSIFDFNNKIWAEDGPPKFIFKSKTNLILLDLCCGNIFNHLQYLKLFITFIFTPLEQIYDINRIILNELIRKQFLVTMITYNFLKVRMLTVLWIMHFYTHYIQLFGNKMYQYSQNILEAGEDSRRMLNFVSYQMCRKNNKYEVRNIPLDISEKYSTLTNLIEVMHRRKESNQIVLENLEEQEILVSLKSIYLYDIVENKDLLRTIIMDFGEQSNETFDVIYIDIYEKYTAARNYFWFDLWIKKIGIYQGIILIVFKTVLMHLMRKFFMYSSLMLENKQVLYVRRCLKTMEILIKKTIVLFDGQSAHDVQIVFESFSSIPLIDELLDNYHNDLISNIKNVIIETQPNSFKLVSNDLIIDPDYVSSIYVRTELYILRNTFSENDVKNIDYLNKVSDSKGMNNNLVRIFLFMKLFKKSFPDINLKSILSCLKFIEIYQTFTDCSSQDRENFERLLEL